MKKTTLFNVSGAVVAIGAAVILLQDHAPFQEAKFESKAHEAYINCLQSGYEKGGAKEWRLLLKAYRGCKATEAVYRADLNKRGVVKKGKMLDHLEQINEAAIARHLGLNPEATKGWGCLKPKKPPQQLIS